MKAFTTLGQALALSALVLGSATGSVEARGQSTLKGQISLKGQPVSGSSITLWQTQAGQAPKQLSTHRSNKSGAFNIKVRATQGVVYYLVAQGGVIGGSSACFEASTDSGMTARGDAHSKPQRPSKREPGSYVPLHQCLPRLTSTSIQTGRNAAQDPPRSRPSPKPSVATPDVPLTLP